MCFSSLAIFYLSIHLIYLHLYIYVHMCVYVCMHIFLHVCIYVYDICIYYTYLLCYMWLVICDRSYMTHIEHINNTIYYRLYAVMSYEVYIIYAMYAHHIKCNMYNSAILSNDWFVILRFYSILIIYNSNIWLQL